MDLLKLQEDLKPVARKGSMLEELVERIFQAAGFEVKRNVFITGFEIDVLAVFGDRTMIIECKQYEKSYLPVKNLILQWKGKNEWIKADTVILVLYGVDVSEEEADLAASCGIKIWGIEELNTFLGLVNEQERLSATILEALQLRERDIVDTNATAIKELIWKSLLKGQTVPELKKYKLFRDALRNRIITNLKEMGSTAQTREQHVNFFERAIRDYKKVQKQCRHWWFGWSVVYREEVHKLNHKEIWEDIKSKLETIKPFEDKINTTYLNYAKRLEQGLEEYYDWFTKDRKYRNKRLIAERIQALAPGEYARFKITLEKASTTMRVYIDEIVLNSHTVADINTLEWILTDRAHEIVDIKNENGLFLRHELHWSSENIEKTIEYVFRILYEYYRLSDDATILDIA